jgi:phenylacetate-CoA oxygenase PaaH subunit
VIYEVFRRERLGQPFEHAGSFPAADDRFAEVYARELYARRNESEALWIVPRREIRELDGFVEETDASYRRVDGYSLRLKLREARERAGNVQG